MCGTCHRLSYVVWLLDELEQCIPSEMDVYIMYDVACTLVQYLKANSSDTHLLERLNLLFHHFMLLDTMQHAR